MTQSKSWTDRGEKHMRPDSSSALGHLGNFEPQTQLFTKGRNMGRHEDLISHPKIDKHQEMSLDRLRDYVRFGRLLEMGREETRLLSRGMEPVNSYDALTL